MSKTYRNITYRWREPNYWSNEIECYGFANVKGEYWQWRKEVGNQQPDPWYFTKCLPKLKGVKLKHFNKRDKKPYHKPNKIFKQIREAKFRAKCKMALIEGNDFPPYIKTDIWEWD